jgi:hypothetical protein
VPYDVKRLAAIQQGTAEISDRDAVAEISAAMVETMVRAYPTQRRRLHHSDASSVLRPAGQPLR